MEISALGSGSSGNCFFIANSENGKAILIDAGLSAKQTIERLARIKRSPETIKGIFITHEHTDHVKGADVLAREFGVPIFATKNTIKSSFLCSNKDLIHSIKNDETISLGGMKIQAFSKSHKAADPVSFSIKKEKQVSVITDLGIPCENTINAVSNSDLLCIESNHDVSMLDNGPYPYFLKRWIKSDIGHLSNKQASLCILEHAPSKLKNIVLSHLSETNNTPALALKTFKSLIKERSDLEPKLHVSERDFPTSLFKV